MKLRILMMLFSVLLVTACTGGDKDEALGDAVMGGEEAMTSADGPYGNTAGLAGGPTQEGLVTQAGDRIFFGYDQYNLTDEARNTLMLQAEWMKQYPEVSVVVEGHADERGTREYNLALAERRANSVKNYLIASGIDPTRLRVISYGKERPAVPGSTPSAWAQNRRGVTVVE